MATKRREGDRADHAVRSANLAQCAAVLRDEGQATVTGIARRTGISRPTVEAVLATLIARGMVIETADRTPGGRGTGRPARLYAFHDTSGFLIGVDVGSHTIRVAVAALSGRVLRWHDEPIEADVPTEGRARKVVEIISAVLAAADIPRDALVAMGVAVPGLVDPDGRVVVSHVLPDWNGTDVAGLLRAEFACPVRVDNDMRLASLAEHRLGAARGAQDAICLFVGHRASMGLILGGRVRRGHHSAAGEVGDVLFAERIEPSGELRWRSADSAAEVFAAAAAGLPAAAQEVDEFTADLSRGVATLMMGIDPDLIVIGGGISRAGDALLEPLRTAVRARITVPASPKIVTSQLGADAVVLGALVRACAESVFVTGVPEPAIDVGDASRAATGSTDTGRDAVRHPVPVEGGTTQ